MQGKAPPSLCAVLGWGTVAIALLPLGCFASFHYDWFNHAWLLGHYAAAFKASGQWPSFLSAGVIESGGPSLYGYLFYRLFSLPTLILGSDLTVRLAAIGSLAACFMAWRSIARKLTGSEVAATLVGLSASVTPYLLTNLYNRSALTEYYALQWFALVLAINVRWLAQSAWEKPAPCWLISLGFLGLALVAGTHPITFYLGLLIFGPAFPLVAVLARWRPSRVQILAALASAGGLAGFVALWVYDSASWAGHLSLLEELTYYPDHIDHPLARLLPLAIDFRSLDTPVAKIATPFLESQVSILPFILGLIALVRIDKSAPAYKRSTTVVLGVAATTIVLLILASLRVDLYTGSSGVASATNGLLRPIQYAYRLSGPIQLGVVLFLTLGLWVARPPAAPGRWIWIGLVLCVASVLLKVGVIFTTHAAVSTQIRTAANYRSIIADSATLPETYYAMSGYALRDVYRPTDQAGFQRGLVLNLAIDPLHPWRTLSYHVTGTRPGDMVITNAICAPFLQVNAGGHVLDPAELLQLNHRLAFRPSAENIEVFAGVPYWRHVWLNTLPWLWLAWLAALVAAAVITRRKTSAA